jgi:hypothetical protein
VIESGEKSVIVTNTTDPSPNTDSVFGTAPSGHAFGSSEIHIRWVSIRRRKVLGGLGSACMLSARSVMTRDIGDKCVATS